MTQEEVPRIHTLDAACCDLQIINFEVPSEAVERLERRARAEGWEQSPDGSWTCRDHRGRS